MLEPMDDVFDPALGGPAPSPSVNPDKFVVDDDDVPAKVTHKLSRLDARGRPLQAPSASELMPSVWPRKKAHHAPWARSATSDPTISFAAWHQDSTS